MNERFKIQVTEEELQVILSEKLRTLEEFDKHQKELSTMSHEDRIKKYWGTTQ